MRKRQSGLVGNGATSEHGFTLYPPSRQDKQKDGGVLIWHTNYRRGARVVSTRSISDLFSCCGLKTIRAPLNQDTTRRTAWLWHISHCWWGEQLVLPCVILVP